MKNIFIILYSRLFLILLILPIMFSVGCSEDHPSAVQKTDISKIPHLMKQGNTTQLVVDGKPFLLLGGELHNSSTSGLAYMQPIWKRMAEANLNTVIAPASWELVEPTENHFNFTLIDSMILGARKENLRLVIIWFGSWKNSSSQYVPAWVKKDQLRFPLVINEQKNKLNILSTFGDESCSADAKAFAALMKHIGEIDKNDHTVVMIQVENELGTLLTKRDFSDVANTAFNGPVPEKLMNYLEKNKADIHPGVLEAWRKQGFRKEGTWEEVFGKGELLGSWKDLSYLTEELFMAWNYARYVGKIAKEGKAEYNLPMYVNAWLKQPVLSGYAPGDYPSGDPSPQVIDIWRAAAPAIDFIAPDIYDVDQFRYECEQYTLSGNPLFIPETSGDAASASRAFYSFGKFHAMGYSPFGIDGGDFGGNVDDISIIKDAYSTLNQLIPIINKYKGTENMVGMLVDNNKQTDTLTLGGFKIEATLLTSINGADLPANILNSPGTGQARSSQAGGALIICTGPGEYFIAGRNMRIKFSSQNPGKSQNIDFLLLEDGTFKNNDWLPGRRLNGDELYYSIILPPDRSKIFKAALYTY